MAEYKAEATLAAPGVIGRNMPFGADAAGQWLLPHLPLA